MRLLEASLEEIGGLEEDSGGDAGDQAGEEVECWVGFAWGGIGHGRRRGSGGGRVGWLSAIWCRGGHLGAGRRTKLRRWVNE